VVMNAQPAVDHTATPVSARSHPESELDEVEKIKRAMFW
jgi:hypothetical protein